MKFNPNYFPKYNELSIFEKIILKTCCYFPPKQRRKREELIIYPDKYIDTLTNAFGEGFSDLQMDHSTLHHFALEIDKEDYANVLNFCSASNIEYVTEVFEWINWRSIFIKDPESNVV